MQGDKKLNLRTSQAEKQTMTTNLADITKTDLAAEVDRLRAENTKLAVGAHKLEIELAGAGAEIAKLQGELTELAARPCLACAVLPTNTEQLEGALQHALLLLDGVDKSELQLTPRWSEWTSFLRERAQLWEIYNRLTSAQKGA